MNEFQKECSFHPADLIEYVVDKPIGAVRAALKISLKGTDISPYVIIGELSENMELNRHLLKQLSSALKSNPQKVIDGMPDRIRDLQLCCDLGL
ncbi:hypothetical protein [Pseudomonas oryzihabitans]|uniref:hypothetical protein n=1 Tax=Pseudomonas oryzihabitans TaxID=47885 RepID=UPI00286126EA|nr:hypothetical protein [Pseudomonas psychrotolerans]MDR6676119.1 hypothetical protein [Pseudomonas psychrotolerans]